MPAAIYLRSCPCLDRIGCALSSHRTRNRTFSRGLERRRLWLEWRSQTGLERTRPARFRAVTQGSRGPVCRGVAPVRLSPADQEVPASVKVRPGPSPPPAAALSPPSGSLSASKKAPHRSATRGDGERQTDAEAISDLSLYWPGHVSQTRPASL